MNLFELSLILVGFISLLAALIVFFYFIRFLRKRSFIKNLIWLIILLGLIMICAGIWWFKKYYDGTEKSPCFTEILNGNEVHLCA